jgi:hypothetical protein
VFSVFVWVCEGHHTFKITHLSQILFIIRHVKTDNFCFRTDLKTMTNWSPTHFKWMLSKKYVQICNVIKKINRTEYTKPLQTADFIQPSLCNSHKLFRWKYFKKCWPIWEKCVMVGHYWNVLTLTNITLLLNLRMTTQKLLKLKTKLYHWTMRCALNSGSAVSIQSTVSKRGSIRKGAIFKEGHLSTPLTCISEHHMKQQTMPNFSASG